MSNARAAYPVGATIEGKGLFNYISGTLTVSNTSAVVPSGYEVRAARFFAVGAADAGININGGNTIPVRSSAGFDWSPRSALVGPTIHWVSGTVDYFIEYS